VGVDGRIYLYGGSTVSVYDPASAKLILDVPELRTQPGTYIRALFVQ
jgi:hypothetical protein